MKNFRIQYRLLPLLFMAFLLLPFLNDEFHFFDQGESQEQRKLAETPVIKYDSIDLFPSAFDAYYNDHFSFRNTLVKWHSYASYTFLNKSSYPDLVVVGKDGWLFYKEGFFPVDCDRNLFSQAGMQKFSELIKSRTEFYQKKGAHYYVFIIPNKQTVYSEFLPIWLQVEDFESQKNRIDQLVQYFSDSSDLNNVYYFRQPLLEMKNEGQLFKKLDHHWNNLGSFYMSSFVLDQISRDFPQMKNVLNFNNFELGSEESFEGDLAGMLGIKDLVGEVIPKITPVNPALTLEAGELRNYPPPYGFPYPWDYEKVMTTHDTTLPKALIIRDSFTNYMLDQLSYGFSESIYIWDFWNYGLNAAIFDKEQPQVVINILVEKNVETLVNSKK